MEMELFINMGNMNWCCSGYNVGRGISTWFLQSELPRLVPDFPDLSFYGTCTPDDELDSTDCLDWLQSLKQFFTNVSYHILVASLTLMALFHA